MADNLAITQGSGTTVATDDIGSAHYQKIKVVDGTADSTNPLTVNASGEALVKVNAALPTGTNSLGSFGISEPLPTGTKSLGTVGIVGPLPSLPTGTNSVGSFGIIEPLPTGTNNIGKVTVIAVLGGSIGIRDVLNSLYVQGAVAHDAVDAGNPILIGAHAKSQDGTDPGSVAEDDLTYFKATRDGRIYVSTEHPYLWSNRALYASAQTSALVKAAPGVNLSTYLTDIIISNGATAGTIALLEGAGVGTIMLRDLHLAINGGAVLNLRTPIKLSPNQELWLASNTVTNHSITVSGYIAP